MAEIVCILGCAHSGHADGAENGHGDSGTLFRCFVLSEIRLIRFMRAL
jgi:hypothetical protein